MTAGPFPSEPNDPFNVPLPAVDDQQHLAEDVTCRECGYNLRGIHVESACPECGSAVGWSIKGDFLRYSNPDWVATLAEGMAWLLTSVVLSFIFSCISRNIVQSASSSAQASAALAAGLELIPSLVGAVGYWKVTQPEPTDQPAVELLTGIDARRTARWCMIGSVFCGALQVPLQMGQPIIAVAFAVLSAVLGIVGFLALLVYARRIARRLPDDRLARHTYIVLWGYIALYVLSALMAGFVFAIFGTGNTGTGAGVTLAAIGIPLLIAWLVFGIWGIVLLVQFRRGLTEAARHARETWARETLAT